MSNSPFSIDEEDIIQTLTKAQKAMEKDYVKRYVQDLPVPLKVTPQEAVSILKGNCFMTRGKKSKVYIPRKVFSHVVWNS